MQRRAVVQCPQARGRGGRSRRHNDLLYSWSGDIGQLHVSEQRWRATPWAERQEKLATAAAAGRASELQRKRAKAEAFSLLEQEVTETMADADASQASTERPPKPSGSTGQGCGAATAVGNRPTRLTSRSQATMSPPALAVSAWRQPNKTNQTLGEALLANEDKPRGGGGLPSHDSALPGLGGGGTSLPPTRGSPARAFDEGEGD